MAGKGYDFGGWASRYDVPCSDGRTIRKNAFKDMDGEEVSLIWGHEHNTPMVILGKAVIEHRDEGPYIWGSFNDTPEGQHAKEAVRHGDVKYLSIYANHLKQQAGNVLHGIIREVSLVYGGANPGAFIDNAVLQHADGSYSELDDEAIIFSGNEIEVELELEHTDKDDEKGEEKMADEKKAPESKDERTVKDVFDEMTEEQKNVVYFMIGEAVKDAKGDSEDEDEEGDDVKHSDGGNEDMKYNAFENGPAPKRNVITHEDQGEILGLAKDSRVGSFQKALEIYREENSLQHDDETPAIETSMNVGGFDNVDPLSSPYSQFTSFTKLLPEYQDAHPGIPPELVTNDQGWINTVMSKTHKSPISRVRTGLVDIRNAEQLRAKGYQKGRKKDLTGQIKLAYRTTDPQTIYVKNELHRDDIIDITDFDYVQYLYNIDRLMLNEELATAIMLGDGREDTDPDKIFPEHIRPIWTDDDLYVIHKDIDFAALNDELQGRETGSYFGENYVTAESMIQTVLYAREDFRGTGTPDMFITPHMLNVMLLSRDMNGRRIFSSKAELASALNVGNIFTAEQFANKTRTVVVNGSEVTKKLHAIIVNLNDYTVGSTKGGQVTHFTQFDIDFNKQKSLLETRLSGALTKIYSAIVIEEQVTT